MTARPPTISTVDPRAIDLRRRLGIPAEARQVLVVTESTHWDPNWLATSEEYFRLMVQPTLDRVLAELVAEPRRVFDVECVFYPAMYWDRRPEQRDTFRNLIHRGQLRFTGSGVTTPDTLLPEEELLLRDLLEGNEWLRARDLHPEPRVLYLPDSFGHSPGLPSLLRAAGVPYASICRIDGMRFPGAELESPTHFPVPGTSAATLTDAGTADFVWRAPDGAEVLAHWHAFGYGHGDLLASAGFTRAMGLPLAVPSRRPDKVAARITRYVDQLTSLSRTPYLLLSIGLDFTRPIPRLVDLLDTWNTDGYDRTGVWALNAGLDDYFDLIATHRDHLPTIDLDPNPYWTGFYATRPALKRRCRDLGRTLVEADHDAVVADLRGDAPDRPRDLARSRAWWIAATTNHHDDVTGTSPDRVARAEQWPMLMEASGLAVSARTVTETTPALSATGVGHTDTGVRWRRERHLVHLDTPFHHAVFDEAAGGGLTSLTTLDGTSLLTAGSLTATAHRDRGGLWRMGMEFPGGAWDAVDSTRHHHGDVRVEIVDGGARVHVTTTLDRRPVHLVVVFSNTDDTVLVHTRVVARLWRTVTLELHHGVDTDSLTMDQPGGAVVRPLQRRYDPTFWPFHSWVIVDDATRADRSMTLATAVPTALHAGPSRLVEVVVARNAPRELAWGIIPLLGPAAGHEPGFQTGDLAVRFRQGPSNASTGRALQRLVDRFTGRPDPDRRVVRVAIDAPGDDVAADGSAADVTVEVTAVKPAQRGEGTIVRLRRVGVPDAGAPPMARLELADDLATEIVSARRCDALERDHTVLEVDHGLVRLPVSDHLTTVRLETRRRAVDTARGGVADRPV